MAHLVSAFFSQRDNRLVFARLAVEDKSNEIVVIPQWLALLDLHGARVTIDAAACRRTVSGDIVAGAADFVLSANANQPTLPAKVSGLIDDLALDHTKGLPEAPMGCHEETTEAHGRIETRRT